MQDLIDKKVLVTGGAGFIGSHLVDGLLDTEVKEIVVIDDFSSGLKKNLAHLKKEEKLKIINGNLTDFKKMKEIFKKENVDLVFDLATIPLPISLKKPTVCHHISLMATNIAELGRLGFYKTVVHTSSSEVYGSSLSYSMTEEHPLDVHTTYAAGKAAADLIFKAYHKTYGLDIVIPRPFNVYGPRQRNNALIPNVIKCIMKGKDIKIYGNGQQSRDFSFVTDIVNGILLCYETDAVHGHAINLCSEQPIPINDILRGMMCFMNQGARTIYESERLGDVRRHCGDNTLAKRMLGYTPKTSLEEGLKMTIDWWRKNG